LPEESLADASYLEQLFPYVNGSTPPTPTIYSCVRAPEEADPHGLADWDSDLAFVNDVCVIVCIPPRTIGSGFRCILPGHAERRPSASLYREPRQGWIVYCDWHTRSWYVLAEVYAAVKSGSVRKLRGPELARWKLRLLVETGRLTPETVPLPPLPADAPQAARRVYKGFRLLFDCRSTTERPGPAPFTRDFGSAWCGVGPTTFETGKGWLIENGLIKKAGVYGRMTLWLPGDGRAT
jgi:hypothetical protein